MALPIRLTVRPVQPVRLERFPGQPIALERLSQAAPVMRLAGVVGPQGPAGPQGASAQPQRIDFVNAATWSAEHNLGRVPAVLVYLASGERIVADEFATSFNFTITHAQPQSGFVLLN